MSVPTCFQSAIGFSRKEDSCVTDAWDSSYADSDSGLYVDELPGFPQRFVASLGGNYNIWEKMTNALTNAIGTFKIDVLQAILKYKEPSRQRFKGYIGRKTFTNALTTNCTYRGLRMYSDITGGSFILRGVYLMLNTTENVTLEIYDEYDLLYSYVITGTAGRPVYTAITPVSLPLGGNYYFLYTATGKPYDNKLSCNCGGYHWCFNTENPCYKYSRDSWTEWSMVAGVCGDDLSIRDDWNTYSEAQGLVLHGEFTCDVFGSLCTDYTDFVNNEIDFAIANAIWYKTGEFLSIYVMDSEEVCRATLLGVEQWNANRLFYNERYKELIEFIASNFEEDRNECLKCRSPFGFQLQSQRL
jgi:hypothetical protein